MNRTFKGTAALAACLIVPWANGKDEQLMEHVIVTAPLHKTEAETALPVTVLSGDKLFDRAANTIGETLRLEPGISSSSFGPGVGQPVIRGQSGRRVSVMQNGIIIQDAAGLSADHANSTEPMVADSIEVIRGPATLLYGSGTIGGVVNIIDSRIPVAPPQRTEMGLEYRHNSVNDQNTVAGRLLSGVSDFAFYLDGVYRRSNDVRIPGYAINDPNLPEDENTHGFIANSDAEAKSYTGGLSWSGDWGFVGGSVGRIEDNYGIPPGSHEHGHEDEHDAGDEDHDEGGNAEEDVRIDLEQTRYDLKSELYHPASWIEALRLHLVHNDYEHVELEGNEIGTRFRNNSWNFRGELVHHQIGGLHGAIGLDYRRGTLEAIGEEAFIPKSDIENIGLFLLEDFHAGSWTIELGLRGDHEIIEPDDPALSSVSHTPWTASASAAWDLAERHSITMALARAQRAPQVEELFSNVTNVDSGDYVVHAATGAVEIGDPNLDPETSWNLDLGWRHAGDYLSTGINFFYNRFEDYIFLNNTGLVFNPEECSGVVICGLNIADEGIPVYRFEQQAATFRGVELDMNVPLFERGRHDLNLDIFGDYIRGTLDDSGEDVPRMPPWRLGGQLNYGVSMFSTYVRVFHATDQDHPGTFENSTDAWTQLDAAVYMRVPVADNLLTLFLKGNNLTNAEIRNSTSFLRDVAPEPGRGIEVGFRFER